MGKIEESLKEFYRKNGLSVDGFKCDLCSDLGVNSVDWWRGSEAYVGDEYGEPRTIFVSLDRGAEAKNVKGRWEEIERVIREGFGSRNRHLPGTLQTINALLGRDVFCEDRTALRKMALVNSAKCTPKQTGMNVAPDLAFSYCAPYLLPELQRLRPRIVVVQGNRAWASLIQSFGEQMRKRVKKVDRGKLEKLAKTCGLQGENLGYVLKYATEVKGLIWTTEIDGNLAVLLWTWHPSSRGGQWELFSHGILPIAGKLVSQLAKEIGV